MAIETCSFCVKSDLLEAAVGITTTKIESLRRDAAEQSRQLERSIRLNGNCEDWETVMVVLGYKEAVQATAGRLASNETRLSDLMADRLEEAGRVSCDPTEPKCNRVCAVLRILDDAVGVNYI